MTLPRPTPGGYPPRQPQTQPPISGLGILCIVLGIIIVLPAGLCSVTLIGLAAWALAEGETFRAFLEDGLPMLFAALAPLAVGIVLIWAGMKLRKPQ